MTSRLGEIMSSVGKRADGFGMKAYKNNWMIYAIIILIVIGVVFLFKR